jgi:hypothetical protein
LLLLLLLLYFIPRRGAQVAYGRDAMAAKTRQIFIDSFMMVHKKRRRLYRTKVIYDELWLSIVSLLN